MHANLERARRVFRSRTLPVPGSDSRLIPVSPERFTLEWDLEAIVLEGIEDEAVQAILAPPGSSPDDPARSRVVNVEAGVGDGENDVRHAGDLLGSFGIDIARRISLIILNLLMSSRRHNNKAGWTKAFGTTGISRSNQRLSGAGSKCLTAHAYSRLSRSRR